MNFLLKFILISILLSWLLRVVIAYFARNFLNNSGGRQQNYNKTRRREGEMHITKQPGGRDKKIRKDVGEYVDYEEIK
ncbi:MAG: DUF4834 family protein [Prevotellaceae bacterium]|jgi:hypothetical protein|nr:DUF4834 family protein [Prevotellaceae bacterium]